jgi:hypothetical protein
VAASALAAPESLMRGAAAVADLALRDVPGHLHMKSTKQCKTVLIQCSGSLRRRCRAPGHGPGGLGPRSAPGRRPGVLDVRQRRVVRQWVWAGPIWARWAWMGPDLYVMFLVVSVNDLGAPRLVPQHEDVWGSCPRHGEGGLLFHRRCSAGLCLVWQISRSAI